MKPDSTDPVCSNAKTDAAAFVKERMASGGIDLHLHTNHSDGSDSPEQLIVRAITAGLRTIAITDHDTVSAIPESAQLVSSQLLLIPGIELSVAFQGRELHLLGYFPFGGTDKIRLFLADQRKNRRLRNKQMIARLNELGYTISQEEFAASGKGTTGRLQAAVILRDRGYFSSISAAFDQLLGENKPGYVDRPRPEIEDAITLIHQAGGTAVLAHPALYGWCSGHSMVSPVLLGNLARLRESGLDGVEAFHGETAAAEQIEVSAAAIVLDLLRTAGSDDHGQNKNRLLMYQGSQFWPNIGIKEILVVAALCQGPELDGQPSWLIARRAPGEKHAGFWELPGGKVDSGEKPSAALVRELKEELSVDAEVGEMKLVLSFDYPDQRVVLIAFDTKIDRQAIRLSVHDRLLEATAAQALTMNVLPADIELFLALT